MCFKMMYWFFFLCLSSWTENLICLSTSKVVFHNILNLIGTLKRINWKMPQIFSINRENQQTKEENIKIIARA